MTESFQSAYAKHVRHFLDVVAAPDSSRACRTCGFTDCPGANMLACPRWDTRDQEPERFGPGLVTDMCRCGHERGEHWDGEGTCDPQTCGCRTFRAQQAD